MTKEHKLALVIGFGIFLIVGIAISDHFSVARSQTAADLRPPDEPRPAPGADDPELIVFNRPASPPVLSASSPSTPAENVSPPARLDMPDLQNPRPRIGGTGRTGGNEGAGGRTSAGSFVFHDVRPGESLSSICQKHYGNTSLLNALARYNKLRDPDLLRAGRRLRIPDISALGGSPGLRPENQGVRGVRIVAERRVSSPLTYTVRSGDSLSEIAQRKLGSAGRWNELYRINRSVIADPDELEVGAVLRIPSS